MQGARSGPRSRGCRHPAWPSGVGTRGLHLPGPPQPGGAMVASSGMAGGGVGRSGLRWALGPQGDGGERAGWGLLLSIREPGQRLCAASLAR